MPAARRHYVSGDGASEYAAAQARSAARVSQAFQHDWMTAPDVAAFAAVSLQTVITARRNGELRFHEIDGTMRADPQHVRAWARAKRFRFA